MFHRLISVLLVNAVVCFAETPARIYVYVPRNAIVRSWVAITCDGPLLARVRQGRFFAVDLPAGRHVLAIQDGVPLIVDLHSGEDAYLRLDAEVRVGERPTPVLSAVAESRVRDEMRFLSYLDGHHIAAASVLRTDPRPAEPRKLRQRERSASPD